MSAPLWFCPLFTMHFYVSLHLLLLFIIRRDKTINYFSIMVKKRLKNTDGSEALDEDETDKKQKKGGKKKSSLVCNGYCSYRYFTIIFLIDFCNIK